MGKIVEINTRNYKDKRGLFSVLVHELTHEILHTQPALARLFPESRDSSKLKKLHECHAEAVSYIVCKHFGLNNIYHSGFYLHGHGVTKSKILQEKSLIMSTSWDIIKGIRNSITKEKIV